MDLNYSIKDLAFLLCQKMSYPQCNRRVTLNKPLKEVKLGRMLGPFQNKPSSNLRVPPVGLTPKDDGTWRLITNLS